MVCRPYGQCRESDTDDWGAGEDGHDEDIDENKVGDFDTEGVMMEE